MVAPSASVAGGGAAAARALLFLAAAAWLAPTARAACADDEIEVVVTITNAQSGWAYESFYVIEGASEGTSENGAQYAECEDCEDGEGYYHCDFDGKGYCWIDDACEGDFCGATFMVSDKAAACPPKRRWPTQTWRVSSAPARSRVSSAHIPSPILSSGGC